MSDPVRFTVGVVGTGRVGAVLGAALHRAGHHVVAASGVSKDSVRRAQRLLPDVPLLSPDDVVQVAELVLVTVPDDALRPLVAGLAATDAWRAGQLVVHTSGANGIGVLDPAAARGAIALALHPAMTFAGRPEDLDRLDGAVFGITSEPDYRPVAEALVLEIGGEPVWIPELARPVYHAALTHAANHLVTLLADSMQLLAEAGVDAPARMLAPLSGAALDNTLRLGDGALTGPISRGDARTVREHVTVLRQVGPEVLAAYVAMARRTADRAVAAGRITPDQHEAVVAALQPD
jgi:predicted short-subunit dehydrogenase-like oxidoreductase (DUF2520 family)